MAQIYERRQDWDTCIELYESLGAFFEQRHVEFLAADAYEHAAEMMVEAGRDVAGYRKPIELWEKNIKHWEEHGHDHDAVWSREHIALYKKLFGVTI